MRPSGEGGNSIFVAMQPNEFRRHGHAVVDWIADYLDNPEQWPVLPAVRPNELRSLLPQSPPARGESIYAVLEDFRKLIVPATTHWNHPAFMAYFANSSTGAGILGEALTAALNVNAMLWKTSPAATELELLTLDWLRQMLGLPEKFFGVIGDTASANTLYALAAARELHPELRIREEGMSGRADLPRLTVYCSEEAHSSVDKAVMTLGYGLEALRKIPTDSALRLDPRTLRDTVENDVRAGRIPIAVVATVGTTSTTAVDPVAAIADITEKYGMWLHVDASYAGSAAILPEMRDILAGCERAESMVVNPHKWLFTPVDCSVLYTRRPDLLKRAFQHIPEYLVASGGAGVANLMNYGVALGRRFRALKLWFVIRNFGVDGLRSMIREHIRIAGALAEWIDSDAEFERLADAKFSSVVFRHRPPGLSAAELDAHNAGVVERVLARREVFLSHTRVRGKYALRIAIGNIHTTEAHVRHAFDLVREAAKASR